MGRVARYKKIRACDPYSKQNGGKQSMTGIIYWAAGQDNGRRKKKRSATAIALRNKKLKRRKGVTTTSSSSIKEDENPFDLPPSGGDDFDIKDLFRVKKQPKPKNELEDDDQTETSSKKMTHIQATDIPQTLVKAAAIRQDPLDEETRVARLLKIDKKAYSDEHSANKHHQSPLLELGRRPGESRKAHQQRIKSETQQLIRKDKLDLRNPEKKQRKKEFLTSKKKKKNNKRKATTDSDNDDEDDVFGRGAGSKEHKDDADSFITGEQAAARVAFGEQVERPPTFQQLPRGAEAKQRSRAMLLPTNSKSSTPRMNNAAVEAKQQAMEKMRQKVQAQYALIKAKRKKTGDFHL